MAFCNMLAFWCGRDVELKEKLRKASIENIFTDGYIAVNIAATDLTVKSAVLGLAVSDISAGMGILKSRRFFCLCRQFRFGKWNPDFSHIGKVDFNCNMLLSADSLRTVNYDFSISSFTVAASNSCKSEYLSASWRNRPTSAICPASFSISRSSEAASL